MRKSLQKTPPSGLSSRLAPLSAGLLAAAAVARQPAAKPNGSAGSRGSGARCGARRRRPSSLAARRCARLLEGFLSRTEVADCAHLALQWLSDELGIDRSICLVRPLREQMLVAVSSHGLPAAATATFTVSLDDWGNPLVNAVNNKRSTFFPAAHSSADRRRRPSTPFEDAAFHVVPLGVSGLTEDTFGLLLLGGMSQVSRELTWFNQVFGQKLHQILRQQALTEGDRKQGRERTLLYSIINAVTDPILLTDTEGRLLIANARALTLFTASEEESEGRRGAVRMNNMLLSSALSSKAIEETGAARRELLLVNPVDGSDLLFELLSTITEDPRHGSGVVSILRNVSDLRRASEEIEENYPKAAARRGAGAGGERPSEPDHRLGRGPDRRHRRERRDVADERAGRAAVHHPDARRRARAAVGAGQRRPLLVVHRRHARQRRSAPRRRNRPDRSENRRGDAGRGHRRQDPVRARRADGRRHHSSRSPRGDRKGQSVRAVEAGLGRARAEDSGGHGRHRAAERAAAPPGDRARTGLRAQVAVPREHVARIPHAAQRHARLHVDAAAGRRRPGRTARQAAAQSHRIERPPSAHRSSTRFSTSRASRRGGCRCSSRRSTSGISSPR